MSTAVPTRTTTPAPTPPASEDAAALADGLDRLITALTATLAAADDLPAVSYRDNPSHRLGVVLYTLRSQLHDAHTLAHLAWGMDRDRRRSTS